MSSTLASPFVTQSVRDFLASPKQLLIGGRWMAARSGKTFPVYDPATGEVLVDVAAADTADVDLAVAAARRALEGSWGQLSPSERGRLIWQLGDLVEEHAEEFSQMEALDTGKPIIETSIA